MGEIKTYWGIRLSPIEGCIVHVVEITWWKLRGGNVRIGLAYGLLSRGDDWYESYQTMPLQPLDSAIHPDSLIRIHNLH